MILPYEYCQLNVLKIQIIMLTIWFFNIFHLKWFNLGQCNKNVGDSSHQSTEKKEEDNKKTLTFQQNFQKIVALRNHKENNSNETNSWKLIEANISSRLTAMFYV